MPPRQSNTPRHAPVLDPRDGLRQRCRANGQWRIWWEPTPKQRKAGATPQDLSALRPGDAQRRATALAAKWGSDAPAAPRGYSISALIIDYKASRYYQTKATSTRESYAHNLSVIDAKWGAQPAAVIDAPAMVLWYEALLAARGVFRAHALLTMMGIVMLHAERRGWIAKGANPCTDLGMDKPPARQRVATAAELVALIDAADRTRPALALALRLALSTGQRQTDLIRATAREFHPAALLVPGRADPVQGYVWQLVRSKRGNAGAIPIIDPGTVALLRARLASAAPGELVITNATGHAYCRNRFGNHFATLRAIAAAVAPSVTGLEWRDLRRTVGVSAREAGVSRDDAGDLLGNTLANNATLAATYTPATLATTLRTVAALTTLPERKKA